MLTEIAKTEIRSAVIDLVADGEDGGSDIAGLYIIPAWFFAGGEIQTTGVGERAIVAEGPTDGGAENGVLGGGIDELEGRFVKGGLSGEYGGFESIGSITELVYTDPAAGVLTI